MFPTADLWLQNLRPRILPLRIAIRWVRPAGIAAEILPNVLRASGRGTGRVHCAFSGDPATHFVHRANMPMLTGEGVMNFFPHGRTELTFAGPYLVALQAIALGGRRSEGKLLIVQCDDPCWTLQFARRYVEDNRRLIGMAQRDALPPVSGPSDLLDREQAGWDKKNNRPKYPDAKAP